MEKKKLVVLTGAGMSAESGISTFRDSNGLWEQYRVEDVATPEGFARDPKLVLDFYNQRRRELLEKRPNPAHFALASLEQKYEVEVITQNIDDLHERAGSSKITHLHGEMNKLRSVADPERIYPIEGWEEAVAAMADGKASVDDFTSVWKEEVDAKDKYGDLLRPHVVFFGEQVPNYDLATRIAATADIFIVCGTSLAVYPAAALVYAIRPGVPIYLVDPKKPDLSRIANPVHFIQERAAIGMPQLCAQLLETLA